MKAEDGKRAFPVISDQAMPGPPQKERIQLMKEHQRVIGGFPRSVRINQTTSAEKISF